MNISKFREGVETVKCENIELFFLNVDCKNTELVYYIIKISVLDFWNLQ